MKYSKLVLFLLIFIIIIPSGMSSHISPGQIIWEAGQSSPLGTIITSQENNANIPGNSDGIIDYSDTAQQAVLVNILDSNSEITLLELNLTITGNDCGGSTSRCSTTIRLCGQGATLSPPTCS